MISLDDDQMQILMTAAAPIATKDRAAFLADVAAELAKYPEVGPGIVSRITSKLQRVYLNGPRDMRGVGSKWG